jgi:hypothetical protein
MATFKTLKQKVIQIHNSTGDAVSELEWKLDRAQIALDGWQRVLDNASHRNKQIRQWEKTFVRQQQRVIHLTDLARTIICEDCGRVISDEHHYDALAGDGLAGRIPCTDNYNIVPF